MNKYFSFPPDIIANFVKMKCEFYYWSNGRYNKEKRKDIKKTLGIVKLYQGFIKQENNKTTVYISFIHLKDL